MEKLSAGDYPDPMGEHYDVLDRTEALKSRLELLKSDRMRTLGAIASNAPHDIDAYNPDNPGDLKAVEEKIAQIELELSEMG
jgi:hypothetical protein